MAGKQAEDADTRSLWFNPPGDEESRRRALTRERVVAEALAVISTDGAEALSMRALARRLGVVPGALYRHVRSKEQLHDLILDAVLAEVDCRTDPALPWIAQVAMLAHRLRAVLENHPGVAALLKTRDPLSPASLELAEAFLAPLLASGLSGRDAARRGLGHGLDEFRVAHRYRRQRNRACHGTGRLLRKHPRRRDDHGFKRHDSHSVPERHGNGLGDGFLHLQPERSAL